MKADIQATNWLKKLFILISIILVLLMATAYIIDPYLYYRVTDNKYMLNSRFVNKGIIENYNYDTVIIGSSMIQNFNMQSFRDKLNYKPIKATIGGMNLNEIEMMNKLVKEKDKTDRIIINLDMSQFNSKEEESRFPIYLYDDNRLNDFKYLLGYETWMRFIPVDIAVNTLYKMDIQLPDKFDRKTNIDYLEDWSKDYSFGKDIVLKSYFESNETVSKQDKSNMYTNMTARFDKFEENIDIKSDSQYIFLFPPYSALYWNHVSEEGYKNILLEFKRYIVENLDKYNNVRIVDMQDLEHITNLDNYKDLTHYNTYIQEIIVDAIKSKEFDATIKNIDQKINSMNILIDDFIKNNKDINSFSY